MILFSKSIFSFAEDPDPHDWMDSTTIEAEVADPVTPEIESTTQLVTKLIHEQATKVLETTTVPANPAVEGVESRLNDPSVAAKASAIVNQLSEGLIKSASNIAKAVKKSQVQIPDPHEWMDTHESIGAEVTGPVTPQVESTTQLVTQATKALEATRSPEENTSVINEIIEKSTVGIVESTSLVAKIPDHGSPINKVIEGEDGSSFVDHFQESIANVAANLASALHPNKYPGKMHNEMHLAQST